MKQNFLFILPWLPYPLKSGGHQALYNGIAAIKDDFNIYLTYEAHKSEEYEAAEQGFLKNISQAHLLPFIHVTKKEKVSFVIRVLRKIKRNVYKFLNYNTGNASSNLMYEREKKWIRNISPLSPDFLEHVNRICQEIKFDIIQVEMPWRISQVLTLPENANKIYVHHELGFVRRELEIQDENTVYTKACKRFADINEIALLNLYDAVITLSPIDAQKLKDAGVICPIFSSFATIDTVGELNPKVANEKVLTFMGPDFHSPNLVGITWFLDNCWSKLKKHDNEYRLNIIGKWSDENIREYSMKYPDVYFLGYVPDLQSVLVGTIMIVPITVGSGIRMKILEACSLGVPFVSTTVGAEGIPVKNGNDCFITDNPDEFLEDIIKLQDCELQKQFVLNANKMVKDNYSIDALRNNRLAIYNKFYSTFTN